MESGVGLGSRARAEPQGIRNSESRPRGSVDLTEPDDVLSDATVAGALRPHVTPEE